MKYAPFLAYKLNILINSLCPEEMKILMTFFDKKEMSRLPQSADHLLQYSVIEYGEFTIVAGKPF